MHLHKSGRKRLASEMDGSVGLLESDEGTQTATDLCDITFKAILKEDNWEL